MNVVLSLSKCSEPTNNEDSYSLIRIGEEQKKEKNLNQIFLLFYFNYLVAVDSWPVQSFTSGQEA